MEKGLIQVNIVNYRDYAKDKHKKVDDETYGGQPGMLLKVEPLHRALIDHLEPQEKPIVLTPSGNLLTQKKIQEWSSLTKITLICGHYEGFDARLFDIIPCEQISVGDYILTGGELPALIIIDALSRLIPGVISNEESINQESFNQGFLEGDQFTRPAEYHNLAVPSVLRTGHHKQIEEFMLKQSIIKTAKYRPDMLKIRGLTITEWSSLIS